MKRRTFISMMSVMAAAGVLSLTGCSNSTSTAASAGASSAAGSAADQLAAIQASGKLIVALEGAWQPWSYHDESDTLVGYDVEVSRAIAEKLGVEPEYVESDWDSLFAGLDAGRFDMVCNGVEVTDERALTYDFTTPYGYIHTALAVRKDNDEIKTFEDLKGKTTANSLLCGALVAFFPLYGLGNMLPDFISNPSVLTPLSLVVSSLYKFAFMLVLVSGGLMAFYRTRMQPFMSKIIPYGKMSLTNYITQIMAGAMPYYSWGFSLHDDLGITASLLAGMAFFILQFSFCKWWMKHHDHGPLEYVWKRATWLK